MMDDTSKEWEKTVDFIYDFIKENYSGILQDHYNKKCNMQVETNESDPKTGTGKKPKGSDRRLYTDENPNDTVSVKFRTKEDIVDTLNKDSFKSKPHKRQSQIINLIHQRVRAAYQNSKDPETKKRLKRAYDYIVSQKERSKEKTIRLQKQEQNESELTEKCWPGYTQKGMKTMFGKRYPNCVKKTKK
jgi:cell division protein FtsN